MIEEHKYQYSISMIFSGIFTILLGSTVLYGWYSKNFLLVQLSPNFVPMQYNTALCFVLSGIASLSIYFRKTNIAIFSFSLVFVISSLTMIQYLMGVNFGIDELFVKHFVTTKSIYPGRMSPNTGICFILYSMICFIMIKENKIIKIIWIINSVLLALCTLAFFGYLLNVEVVFGWQKYTRMALHTSVGFIFLALGSYINVVKNILKENKINLIPLPLGTFLLIVFFILAASLKHTNYLRFMESAEKESTILMSKMNADFNRILEAYYRMALRHEYFSAKDEKFWYLDTKSYLNDYNFFKTIFYVDTKNVISRIVPEVGNENILGLSISDNVEQARYFDAAITERKAKITNIQKMVQGHDGFLLISPLFHDNEYVGALVANVDIELLFKFLVGRTDYSDFDIGVYEGEKLVFSEGKLFNKDLAFEINQKLTDKNHSWQIYFYPNSSSFVKSESLLPEVVVLIGIIISILSGFVAYYTDKLKSLKERSESSDQAKSIFLANMSHEIRTPMNAIIGLTSVLKEEISDKEILEKLDIISNSSNSLLSIINDILDISKIESGKYQLSQTTFHLKSLINEQIILFSPIVHQKKIKFTSNINVEADGYIIADELRLKQILNNLISNALKFTEKGEIILSVNFKSNSTHKNIVVFDIQDTGIGISEEGIGKLFKDFSQVSDFSGRRFSGAGLGLSICKKLVEFLGGEISVVSEENVGTTFSFWIPYEIGSKYSFEAKDIRQFNNIDLAKDLPLSILTVDDNKINLKVAQELLKKIGYSTDVAINGQEALELMKVNRYDIIFMDCHMPILDGFEATQMIINIYGEKKPKIIALTASTMTSDIDRCFAVGMDDFISKPVTFKSFLDVLSKYSEKK